VYRLGAAGSATVWYFVLAACMGDRNELSSDRFASGPHPLTFSERCASR